MYVWNKKSGPDPRKTWAAWQSCLTITRTKMTTLSQKDEQIVRQAEEIESLNRKIESLEKELQRDRQI